MFAVITKPFTDHNPQDEEDEDKWDKIQLGLEPLNEDEISDRMALDDYFMPGGPQRAKEKKEEQRQLEEAAKEEEKLRIKAEKIQQKQEVERERKAAMEEQMRREEEEKTTVTAAKSDESDDEDFGDKNERKSDDEDDEKEGRDKEASRSPVLGSDDGDEHDNVTSEAASKEIDEAIRREIDQGQAFITENKDVEMRSASTSGGDEQAAEADNAKPADEEKQEEQPADAEELSAPRPDNTSGEKINESNGDVPMHADADKEKSIDVGKEGSERGQLGHPDLEEEGEAKAQTTDAVKEKEADENPTHADIEASSRAVPEVEQNGEPEQPPSAAATTATPPAQAESQPTGLQNQNPDKAE